MSPIEIPLKRKHRVKAKAKSTKRPTGGNSGGNGKRTRKAPGYMSKFPGKSGR